MEILAERAIHTMNFWCMGAIGFTFLIIVDVAVYCNYNKGSFLFDVVSKAVMVVASCLAVWFLVLGARHSIAHPVMEYKVRFVEKIDMEEFLDTYEIRDKDGSIITIRCLEPSAPSEETTK